MRHENPFLSRKHPLEYVVANDWKYRGARMSFDKDEVGSWIYTIALDPNDTPKESRTVFPTEDAAKYDAAATVDWVKHLEGLDDELRMRALAIAALTEWGARCLGGMDRFDRALVAREIEQMRGGPAGGPLATETIEDPGHPFNGRQLQDLHELVFDGTMSPMEIVDYMDAILDVRAMREGMRRVPNPPRPTRGRKPNGKRRPKGKSPARRKAVSRKRGANGKKSSIKRLKNGLLK